MTGTAQLHSQESGQEGEILTTILVKTMAGIFKKWSGFQFFSFSESPIAEHNFATESGAKNAILCSNSMLQVSYLRVFKELILFITTIWTTEPKRGNSIVCGVLINMRNYSNEIIPIRAKQNWAVL